MWGRAKECLAALKDPGRKIERTPPKAARRDDVEDGWHEISFLVAP